MQRVGSSMVDTLYIDSNEPRDIQRTTETTVKDRQNNIQIETKGLKTGDFVYRDVVIERKEASDLASSIKDGRLKEQTLRMSEDFQHQYIIIEGNPYNLKYSNLHDNAFIGTMVSRSYAGIPIIYTPGKEGTAYAINKLIEKHGEEGEEKVEELKRTKADTEDVQVAMLTCVEGITEKKAKEILKKDVWSKLTQFVNHDHGGKGVDDAKEKMQEIDGIGKTLSKRVIKAFEDQYCSKWKEA